jgi:hypothetical protein
MRKVLYILVCLILLGGCSAKAIPDWTQTSHQQLESYKKYYLQGKDRLAEISFIKAVQEIKTSGDIDLMEKAYLTRYAVQVSVLEDFDDRDYRKLEAIEQHAENVNFYLFLKGAFNQVKETHLPRQYLSFFNAWEKKGTQAEINHSITMIEAPLSRLIATGLAVQKRHYDETTLTTAIQAAAEQGWKKALRVYQVKLRDYYESINEQKKADIMRKRIDLIE